MTLFTRQLTAKPISVSRVTEVMKNGLVVGESQVTVVVRGRCVSRPMFGDAPEYRPPVAHGGRVHFINYISDADLSVIEYRFLDTMFRKRERTSTKFREYMLGKIAKNIDENTK